MLQEPWTQAEYWLPRQSSGDMRVRRGTQQTAVVAPQHSYAATGATRSIVSVSRSHRAEQIIQRTGSVCDLEGDVAREFLCVRSYSPVLS